MGAFYRSFMDDARVESLGVKAIEPELNEIKNAKSRDELATLMGRATTDFESSLFGCGIDVDLKDPDHYAFYIGQSGLGLPDRDYYLKPDFAAQKKAYQTYVTTLLHLANWAEPEMRAKDVVDFETQNRHGELDENSAAGSDRDLQSDDAGRAEQVRARLSVEELPRRDENGEALARDRRGEERLSEAGGDLRQGAARDDSRLARVSPGG